MKVISTVKKSIAVISDDFKTIEFKECTVRIVDFQSTIQFEYDLPKKLLAEAKSINPTKYETQTQVVRYMMLNMLVDKVNEIVYEVENHHTFIDKVGEKVIFIKFDGQHPHIRGSVYGAGMGINVNIKFNFFVAFRYQGKKKVWFSEEYEDVETFSNYYKTSEFEGAFDHGKLEKEQEIKPLHHTESDKTRLKQEYLIVEWTQGREDYLRSLEKAFIKQCDLLNEYLKDLDLKKLDQLIAEAPIQKLLN